MSSLLGMDDGVESKGVPGWVEYTGRPLPDDPRYDPELLELGDHRNVIDRYRYWSVESIVADLDTRRHDFHVAIENLGYDFNIGTIVRTANAFLAQRIHIVGRRRWNKRGAMVTDRYQHISYHADGNELADYGRNEGLTIVAVDNVAGACPIETVRLPRKSLFVFGGEGSGISAPVAESADLIVAISQYGSTRSINVGVAAGIVMHQWICQHACT